MTTFVGARSKTNTSHQRICFGVQRSTEMQSRDRDSFVSRCCRRHAQMSRETTVACAFACRQHSSTCVHGLLHDGELLQLGNTFAICAMDDEHIVFAHTHCNTPKLTIKLGQQTEQIELNVCAHTRPDRQRLFSNRHTNTHTFVHTRTPLLTNRQCQWGERDQSFAQSVDRELSLLACVCATTRSAHVRST